MIRPPPTSTLFPYTTLFRSTRLSATGGRAAVRRPVTRGAGGQADRKSTRLNSSHITISYAVFCLKKKNVPRIRVVLEGLAHEAAAADAAIRIGNQQMRMRKL